MADSDTDDLDICLIDALQNNALSTLAELGTLVGLKRPAVHERIKRLEKRGYILGYGAKVDYARIGLGLVALVSIYTLPEIEYEQFYAQLSALPEVTVMYSVAGEESFVAQVITRSTGHLDDFLARIKSVKGIARTKTAVVLSTPFDRRSVPVERLLDRHGQL